MRRFLGWAHVLATATSRRVRALSRRLAVGWWTGTLLIAPVPSLAVQVGLEPRPEKVAVGLVATEIPAGWEALPIAARLSGEVVTTSSDGCGEGFGAIRHEAKLGLFNVTWSNWLYKGLDAGETGWGAVRPDLAGSCHPEKQGPGLPWHPDTLHVDEAVDVYVFANHDGAVGACRRSNVVTARAYQPKPVFRIAASAVIALVILCASWTVRWTKRSSPGPRHR